MRNQQHSTVRRSVAIALMAGAAMLSVQAVRSTHAAELTEAVQFNIEPQELDTALLQFSKQSGISVSAPTTSLSGKKSAGVSGEVVVEEALRALLEGTGLTYKRMNGHTVAVGVRGEREARNDDGANEIMVAQAESASPGVVRSSQAEQQPESAAGADTGGTLDEIVVTAQKTSERLQDVPVPVSVISGDSLTQLNQTNFKDYFNKVPGVSISNAFGDAAMVSIRGVTTGGQNSNPTVGIVVNDVPFGASSNLGGGISLLEIDSSDIERLEVLRGPQGTLYGANSIGGLIKYVTADPSVNGFSGRLATGLQGVENGGQVGYNVRGYLNVPTSDVFAIRASAYYRREPGFIDDTLHDNFAFNSSHAYGGRLAALWKPSDTLSVKLNAFHQYRKSNGNDEVSSVRLSDLETSESAPQLTGSTREVNFIEGVVDGKAGIANWTSITGYSRTKANLLNHATGIDALFAPPGLVIGFNGKRPSSKFSEELRFDVPLSAHLDWMVGGFYTKETGKYNDIFTSADPDTGEKLGPDGNIIFNYYPSEFRETALFSDLTVRFTDQFDVQFGARKNSIKQSLSNTLFFLGATIQDPGGKSNENSFTYLLTPRYRISPDFMVYARIASGYRPGGPNFNVALGAPATYAPDKTRNFEIGVKGDLIERVLAVDASVYHIDWEDIQLQDNSNGIFVFINNGGRARSQGAELSFQLKSQAGLRFSAWGAWNDATLRTIPPSTLTGLPGDRLPYSAKYSGNIAVAYQRPILDSWSGLFGTSLNYLGRRYSDFLAAGVVGDRITMSSYTQIDVHAGAESTRGWDVNAFVTNITDKRGITAVSRFSTDVTIIRPRTYGVSVARSF